MVARAYGFLLIPVLMVLVACTDEPAPEARADGKPSVSGSIALSQDGQTLWVANLDANSVTAVNTATLQAATPIPIGHEPSALAVTPNGTVIVVNRQDGTISILENNLRSDVFVGAEPGGVALSPSGHTAFVTVSSENAIAVVDLSSKLLTRSIAVGRIPWAIAVTDDGDDQDDDETVIVSHRMARLKLGGIEGQDQGKEAWLSLIEGSKITETVIAPYSFGYANALEGLNVLGNKVFVTHLLNSPELPRDFEHTVSGALSTVSLSDATELQARRVHINDPDFSTPVNFPNAVALNPSGSRAYITLGGTNAVMGVNLENPEKPKLLGFWAAGQNPRGIVLNATGTRAYVMNALSRDISVLDLTSETSRLELARVTVTPETLSPEMLKGKILFHNANDPRVSHLGWISCATCHFDGGVDGTTWMTPDGPRQTQPLWNLAGTAPFHASGTRDEVADFEHDIEGLMDGIGLAPGKANRELGEPNGKLSGDLDALEKYVLTGIRVPNAPTLDAIAVARGRTVFANAGCGTCHNGTSWTNSFLPGLPGTLAPNGELEVTASLKNVGTLNTADLLGQHGFDVQQLLGLHTTAPYLHDGSAATLNAVLENPVHVKAVLSSAERQDLILFLTSLDANTKPIAP
jgi:YVTN family beta-propeller protein